MVCAARVARTPGLHSSGVGDLQFLGLIIIHNDCLKAAKFMTRQGIFMARRIRISLTYIGLTSPSLPYDRPSHAGIELKQLNR